MKLYLIAGENSGDFIGANFIKSLKNINDTDSNIKFYGIGGSRMQDAGIDSLFSIDQINLIGFFEVLPHLLRLEN